MPYYIALRMPFMLKCCQFQAQNALEFESEGCSKIFSGSLPSNVDKLVSPKLNHEMPWDILHLYIPQQPRKL